MTPAEPTIPDPEQPRVPQLDLGDNATDHFDSETDTGPSPTKPKYPASPSFPDVAGTSVPQVARPESLVGRPIPPPPPRGERTVLPHVRHSWVEHPLFEDKYSGKPISVAAREQVNHEIADLQARLYSALGKNDETQLAILRHEMLRLYPHDTMAIEVLLGFNEALRLQSKPKSEKTRREKKKENATRLESLTQFQFLCTDFVLKHQTDPKFLSKFWREVDANARRANLANDLWAVKRGIISQVGAVTIFREIGFEVELAHPRHDAFASTDFWLFRGLEYSPVQVKTSRLGYPGIICTEDDSSTPTDLLTAFDDETRDEYDSFKKVAQQNMGLVGYFVLIPPAAVNSITGEPTQSLVDFFRPEPETAD